MSFVSKFYRAMANPYQIWKQAKKEGWSDEQYKQKLVDEGIIKKKSDWDKPVEPPEGMSQRREYKTQQHDPNTDIPLIH